MGGRSSSRIRRGTQPARKKIPRKKAGAPGSSLIQDRRLYLRLPRGLKAKAALAARADKVSLAAYLRRLILQDLKARGYSS